MTDRPKILFVDDNSDTRDLLQALLNMANFRVSTASCGAECLDLIATDNFDAFLIDNWMQDTTGIELCRRIRVSDPLTPILICSGAGSEEFRRESLEAGAQGFVKKPFDVEALILQLAELTKSS